MILNWEIKFPALDFRSMKAKAARLQRAMIAFFLDEAGKAGYTEIQPPICSECGLRVCYGQCRTKKVRCTTMLLTITTLIPTAEVPVTNLYRDVIVAESDLPVKNAIPIHLAFAVKRVAGVRM
ncbi:hypothetical protein PEC18_19815 [Paucibacter sp. O1-1]|nr:hypothetical protein [Paucibacter sp. O1-1]MDA3828014.1 hypothetical protein [Paucibacter sp. O1-1]